MKKKQKEPITKGVAKTPLVMQMEATECGAACLTMILSHYGCYLPLEQIRYECGVSRDGANAFNVVKTARLHGMEAKGYRYKLETLREKAQYPCIIYWNYNHFIVLNGFRGGRAFLNDPAQGCYELPVEEFARGYSGICLMMSPGEAFVQSGKRKSILDFTLEKIKPARKDMTILAGITAILSLISLFQPGFTRFFIDVFLTESKDEWLGSFFLLFGFVCVLQVIMEAVQALYSLKVNGKLDIIASTAYLRHTLRLPVPFFDNRVAGDIALRKNENADVSRQLVQTLAPLYIKAILILVYLVAMIRYNVVLAGIGFASIVIKILVARYISNKRINITRVQKRDYGNLVSSTLNAINMIETIKAAGAEPGYFEKWAGYQAGSNAQTQKYTIQDARLGLIPTIVGHLCDVVVLGGGILLVMDGYWSLGMITAFQGVLALFFAPANDFVNATQTIQEMRSSMERIDDVMKTEEEVWNEDIPEGGFAKLSGQISIRNLSFGYSILADPLLSDFSLEVAPGQSIAIVGPSGSGKSTLARLITGLYKPWGGTITFDGKAKEEINRYVFTGSVSSVDQEIHLTNDTIADNIRFGNTEIEDFEVILAAKDAGIHNDILKKSYGYQEVLANEGKDLSGGQRQRIEIARALVQDPTILIMDEATSALDAATENQVMEAIRARGITTIIIAHRLSTIRDCDLILVLDHGKLVEQGTHDELVRRNGFYCRLVETD